MSTANSKANVEGSTSGGDGDLVMSEKLQTDPKLTLESAKTMVRQKAVVKD